MEENYIHIFSLFLADLAEKQKISIRDIHDLLVEFKPVCGSIHSRQELIAFVDKYSDKYWELKELKKQLLDNNHKFY